MKQPVRNFNQAGWGRDPIDIFQIYAQTATRDKVATAATAIAVPDAPSINMQKNSDLKNLNFFFMDVKSPTTFAEDLSL